MSRPALPVPRVLWEGVIHKQRYRLVATCNVREPYPVVDRAERDTMNRRHWLRDRQDFYVGSPEERAAKCREVERTATRRALARLRALPRRR